ncbi:hypothetical protein B0H14DRAFT_3157380 [Mycena olivaceomarginata]|nr:hypothetical protein B0H14DRAFT_3157380 [Mycena olivaceomarginata]
MNIQNIRRRLLVNLRSPVDPNSILSTPFQAVLQALQVSSAPADLIPIVENLSALVKGIEQTPAGAQSFEEVASLLEWLRPIVIGFAEIEADKGQTFVEDLKRELESLTKDLESASSKGQFFIAAHNVAITQIIAESTRPQLYQSSSSQATIVAGGVTGGSGGTGGDARIGGEGGEGDGPRLDLDPNERYKIGNISGGAGGTGGVGIEVGGKGGTGKGPVISSAHRGADRRHCSVSTSSSCGTTAWRRRSRTRAAASCTRGDKRGQQVQFIEQQQQQQGYKEKGGASRSGGASFEVRISQSQSSENLDLASSNPDLKVSTQEELEAQGAMRSATDFQVAPDVSSRTQD